MTCPRPKTILVSHCVAQRTASNQKRAAINFILLPNSQDNLQQTSTAMVYPKHRATPPSSPGPRKKARMSTATAVEFKTSPPAPPPSPACDDDQGKAASALQAVTLELPAIDVDSAAFQLALEEGYSKDAKKVKADDDDSFNTLSSEGDSLALVCNMLINCTAMIATNTSSIKKLEEASAKKAEATDEKFAELLQHIKSLEERIKAIEGQTQANKEAVGELDREAGALVDTVGILEKRLCSVVLRVSSIESLIIRSRKRKLKERGGN